MVVQGSSLCVAFGWLIFSNAPLFLSHKSTSLCTNGVRAALT